MAHIAKYVLRMLLPLLPFSPPARHPKFAMTYVTLRSSAWGYVHLDHLRGARLAG